MCENQQKQEPNIGLQQDLYAVMKCKQELEGDYLTYAWKRGHLGLVLSKILQKHEIGYVRDLLVVTARLHIENGAVYPDEIKEWTEDTRVQLPEPECGTWALNIKPLLVYDSICWIRKHDLDSVLMLYEAKESLKRLSDLYFKLLGLMQGA